MIPELGQGGHLPFGRYLATNDEVEERFVSHADFAGSTNRSSHWSEFLDVLAFLKVNGVRVAAVWLGGTFTTTKLDPTDIDVVFVVDAQKLVSKGGALTIVGALVSGQKAAGLKVHSFVVPWWPEPLPSMGATWDVDQYNWYRGYWDDYWQRDSPNRPPTIRDDALPRRGYLEVLVDGYR